MLHQLARTLTSGASAQARPTHRWHSNSHHSMHRSSGLCVQAASNSRDGDKPNDLVLAGERCPVPRDQQPMFELQALQKAFLFDWATLPVTGFALRLSAVTVGFFLAIGLPISAVTFSPLHEPLQCFVAASVGSLFITTILVFRLYIGWSHVGNRLLSATVEYEETGWYDGQVWVKSPQMLTRDRLLGTYTVKPALDRLKSTLVGMGSALAASFLLLAVVPSDQMSQAASDDGTSSSYSAAAMPALQDEEDYWQKVQEYEPWALEDDAGASQPPSIMSHMKQVME